MTGLEVALKFKIEINKLDRSSSIDLRVEKVLHYINKATLFLVKKKYRGANPGPGRLEVMHPVLDDLKVLMKEKELVNTETTDELKLSFTQDHLYFMSCRVKTQLDSEASKYAKGRYVKPERVYQELDNPFTSSKFDDPMISLSDNSLLIYKEGFKVTDIKYKYLKLPNIIAKEDQMELPFIDEIIDTAVTQSLENFESKRLETQSKVSTSIISE